MLKFQPMRGIKLITGHMIITQLIIKSYKEVIDCTRNSARFENSIHSSSSRMSTMLYLGSLLPFFSGTLFPELCWSHKEAANYFF